MERLKKLVKRIKGKRIAVVGDIIVDHYVWGDTSRISPEAPVPVVLVKNEEYKPGGAANTCNNIISLESEAVLFGVIGEDITGEKAIEIFKNYGVNTDGIVIEKNRPTTLKTRIIARTQQMIRVDKESSHKIKRETSKEILKKIENNIDKFDGIIISDYGKGVINRYLLERLIPLALRKKKIITVDPKIEHFFLYKKVTSITPNHYEAGDALHTKCEEDIEVENAGKKIMKRLKTISLLITRGEKGMTLFLKDKVYHIPTVAKEVYDVTGAGDTVVATFTLCLSSGIDFLDSAKISNIAAGIVVGKIGAATTTIDEMVNYL
ncbi:MAG: D-glycero-beta-D-manno-heptose-7-phosphate kinase [Caldiserica bacterium]|nr:MAG: D-glycero-beta-D-manno-heptose-7-phosphate kinase [Caldisericota bacterium]